jgi:Arc/MetJ-type ribon-helix-helix transcriptional regulator
MKNRIRKFTEAIESDKFKEVSDKISELIDKTLEKETGEDKRKKFLDLFIKNPKETKIEGLISEDDIFGFYETFRNQIDECLNEVKFFDDVPGVNRLYDYIIKGTKFAILEFVKSLSEKVE